MVRWASAGEERNRRLRQRERERKRLRENRERDRLGEGEKGGGGEGGGGGRGGRPMYCAGIGGNGKTYISLTDSHRPPRPARADFPGSKSESQILCSVRKHAGQTPLQLSSFLVSEKLVSLIYLHVCLSGYLTIYPAHTHTHRVYRVQ